MYFSDFVLTVVVIFALVATLFGAVFGIGVLAVSHECSEYSKLNNVDTKVIAANCYLKEGDRWYRWDEYKLRNATTGTSK